MNSRSILFSKFRFILSKKYSTTPLQKQTNLIKMATSTNIHLKPEDVGIVNFGNQSEEAAAKITELLQENHKVGLSINKSISL